jgi:hypothetical protein
MKSVETRLDEADAVAGQIEAVLEAAARMASPAGTADFERAAWLQAVALDLSKQLLLAIKGSDARRIRPGGRREKQRRRADGSGRSISRQAPYRPVRRSSSR